MFGSGLVTTASLGKAVMVSWSSAERGLVWWVKAVMVWQRTVCLVWVCPVKLRQFRQGELGCVKVPFGKSRQLRLVQAARSPVRHGMAVKASWVALRYVLLCQGSYGTSRHEDACYVGARRGTFAS